MPSVDVLVNIFGGILFPTLLTFLTIYFDIKRSGGFSKRESIGHDVNIRDFAEREYPLSVQQVKLVRRWMEKKVTYSIVFLCNIILVSGVWLTRDIIPLQIGCLIGFALLIIGYILALRLYVPFALGGSSALVRINNIGPFYYDTCKITCKCLKGDPLDNQREYLKNKIAFVLERMKAKGIDDKSSSTKKQLTIEGMLINGFFRRKSVLEIILIAPGRKDGTFNINITYHTHNPKRIDYRHKIESMDNFRRFFRDKVPD